MCVYYLFFTVFLQFLSLFWLFILIQTSLLSYFRLNRQPLCGKLSFWLVSVVHFTLWIGSESGSVIRGLETRGLEIRGLEIRGLESIGFFNITSISLYCSRSHLLFIDN